MTAVDTGTGHSDGLGPPTNATLAAARTRIRKGLKNRAGIVGVPSLWNVALGVALVELPEHVELAEVQALDIYREHLVAIHGEEIGEYVDQQWALTQALLEEAPDETLEQLPLNLMLEGRERWGVVFPVED